MELYAGNQCCGCNLCLAVCPKGAISLAKDAEGFLYPSIDHDQCVDCGLCRKICTFNRETSAENTPLASLAVKAKDDILRKVSSSGGVFPLLAEYVINDCSGVVYGAAYLPEQHMKVAHIRIENTADIHFLQGSKYVQSDVRGAFQAVEEDLNNGRQVLFCGTPCQVTACKAYLKHKKADTDRWITCDFVCHGVPSPGLWEEYIQILEQNAKEKVIGYDFRYKDKNCPWGQVNVCAEFEDRREVNTQLVRAFINMYFDNIVTRPACTRCPYTSIQRQSDITLADCWGLEKVAPDFADPLGVSLVLVNSEKAQKMIESIRENLVSQPINVGALAQPHLHRPCVASPKRPKFWQTYARSGLLKTMRRYTNLGLMNRAKRLLIQIMVKVYHVMKGNANVKDGK